MQDKNIRNFAIVAHIDHGKSTLADRFLEITETIPKDKLKEQFLDQSPISRERGITIKLAPVKMNYTLGAICYTLNLIDTPGHIDFSYEVSRTLAACEGAILLVDATQGIQAQTVAHLNVAKKHNLKIIPVINKIDLLTAKPDLVANELRDFFGFLKEEILFISAKNGENVKALLGEVVKRIPPPVGDINSPLKALIFDAVYDQHRGVVAFARIIDGKIKKGDKIKLYQNSVESEVGQVGYFSPFLTPLEELGAGGIGYVITGIKDIKLCRVGDTVTNANQEITPLPGYQPPKPMVFFGVYPRNKNEFIHLKEALSKIILNDSSLSIAEEYSAYLGSGFRVGFLGLLHAEIIKEKLKQEEGVSPILTMPRVLYEKTEDGSLLEPYMNLTIYTPVAYVGSIMSLCQKRKGKMENVIYHEGSAVLKYEMPYSMFIRGLASELKSVSSGFASIDYELTNYRKADLEKLDIVINDYEVDVLSDLVYKDEAQYLAREKTENLKEILPRQQFRQIIQAKIGGNILARTEISPFRKDVLQKMSGGDRTRKDKLLDKQKRGKSKLLVKAKVILPEDALISLISKD
jgi:GTP-binding protein LepA